jgi:hypothetical protein
MSRHSRGYTGGLGGREAIRRRTGFDPLGFRCGEGGNVAEERYSLRTAYTLARHALVAISREPVKCCQCGSPPFTDGNPCPICFAHQMLEQLPEPSEFNAS